MYARQFLIESEKPGNLSGVNYLIFRYGTRNGRNGTKNLYTLPNWKLKRRLTHDKRDHTRDLLILPFNLFLLTLTHPYCKQYTLDQEGSGSSTVNLANNWLFRSGEVNKLHEGSLEHFLDYQDKRELFLLDSLKIDQTHAPKNVFYASYHVTSFPITRHFIHQDRIQEWINHFREYHKEILGRLGIRDLYGEEQTIKQRFEETGAVFPWEKEAILKELGYSVSQQQETYKNPAF